MASPVRQDITITSTTDPIEAVHAALGTKPEESKPAATENPAEAKPATEEKTEKTEEAKPAEEAAGQPTADEAAAKEAAEAAARSEIAKKGGLEKSRLDKRIKQLVDEREKYKGLSAAKDAELEALRQRVGELTLATQVAAKPAEAKTEDTKTASGAPIPKPADFGSYDEFVEAVGKWAKEEGRAEAKAEAKNAVAEAIKEHREKTEADKAATRAQAIEEQYRASLTAAQAAHEDFDEIVDNEDVKLSRTVFAGIKESPIGGELIYALMKDRETLQKIVDMGDTITAAKHLARYEDKVQAALDAAAADEKKGEEKPAEEAASEKAAEKPAAPKKVATKAPDPIKPTKGAAVRTSKPPEEMDYQEFKAWRAQQEKERPRHGLL